MHLETLLFLLPTLVYTDPTWNKVQQQIPRTGSLPLAIVNVVARNEMPVPVSLLLAHQRGNDKSTRKERIYGYQQPGEYWREKYSVLFERSKHASSLLAFLPLELHTPSSLYIGLASHGSISDSIIQCGQAGTNGKL